MSDRLSIAEASAFLHNLVKTAVAEVVPDVVVKIGVPRALATGSPPEVNLHLYRLTQDPNLRSRESHHLHPELVLRLHYALSFSGEEPQAAEKMAQEVIQKVAQSPVLLEPMRILQDLLSLEQECQLRTSFGYGGSVFSLYYVVGPVMVESSKTII
ncbi:MAG: Pvc16 family protein [Acidobacteria bacterium]|nr:Pvc16 family protein [Acidobacteriota bacterium]